MLYTHAVSNTLMGPDLLLGIYFGNGRADGQGQAVEKYFSRRTTLPNGAVVWRTTDGCAVNLSKLGPLEVRPDMRFAVVYCSTLSMLDMSADGALIDATPLIHPDAICREWPTLKAHVAPYVEPHIDDATEGWRLLPPPHAKYTKAYMLTPKGNMRIPIGGDWEASRALYPIGMSVQRARFSIFGIRYVPAKPLPDAPKWSPSSCHQFWEVDNARLLTCCGVMLPTELQLELGTRTAAAHSE